MLTSDFFNKPLKESVAGPEKCWPGHRKVGTKPGTGKNAGKRVNDCEKIKEDQPINEKQSDKTSLKSLDLRSELDPHAITMLNIARKKYPMAKSDLAALIKLLDRVQQHSKEKDTEHDKDIKKIKRDVAALEKRVNELAKKQKIKESRQYYRVHSTPELDLKLDFNLRKDDKGWYLAENATKADMLNVERAFGEPIAESDPLRPIKMRMAKDHVAVHKNKYKNPAQLSKVSK